jgi:hypothetical protein
MKLVTQMHAAEGPELEHGAQLYARPAVAFHRAATPARRPPDGRVRTSGDRAGESHRGVAPGPRNVRSTGENREAARGPGAC